MEHAGEDRAHEVNDVEEAETEDGDDDEIDHSDASAHGERHHEGEDKHERGAYRDADHHHERLLDVCDVGREARDQRGAGEVVDVREAERLDLIEEVVAKVLREAAARVAAGDTGGGAEDQRYNREEHKQARGGEQLIYGGADLDGVDEVRGDEGDGHLAGDLAEHQQGGGHGVGLVVPNALHELAHDRAVADLLGLGA